MRRLLVILMLLSHSVFSFALKSPDQISKPATAQLKTYSEWKQLKAAEVESRIRRLKEKLKSELDSSFESADPNLGSNLRKTEASSMNELVSQIEGESETLSAVNDLTMADYVVGYLSKQGNSDEAIREISGRLKPEEVAELIRLVSKRAAGSAPQAP